MQTNWLTHEWKNTTLEQNKTSLRDGACCTRVVRIWNVGGGAGDETAAVHSMNESATPSAVDAASSVKKAFS